MNSYDNNLLIMLVSGNEDAGKRTTLAFSAGCTAVAMGKDAQIFLAGDGSYWGYRGRENEISVSGFPTLSEPMLSFEEPGGRVYICSACDQTCSVQGADEEDDLLRHDSVDPRGLASVLDMLEAGKSLTF